PEKKDSKQENGVPKTKVQTGVAKALIKAKNEGLPVVGISSDLPSSTGTAAFHKEFPEHCIDVGVAEANMISAGAGMSKVGLIPVVDTFAAFGVTKGNLPLIMASLSQAPIIGIFSHIGFQDAADGASHQSTTYFAAVSSIPHVKVYCLSCADEAEALVYEAIQTIAKDREAGKDGESHIFFLGRENHPVHYGEHNRYNLDKAQVLEDGNQATVVATGGMVEKALQAASILQDKGIEITVINNNSVNHPDIATISESLEKTCHRLITLEDHQITGGMGAMLIHELVKTGNHNHLHVKNLGMSGEFGQSAYVAEQLYAKYEMDADAIVKAVEDFIGVK
ncbi:MAG: transketolase family protein, partial [Bacteriovoracia bacterium]